MDGKDVEYEKGCTAADTIGETVENIGQSGKAARHDTIDNRGQ